MKEELDMNELVNIAEGILKSCLDAKEGESVLVVTDDSRRKSAKHFTMPRRILDVKA